MSYACTSQTNANCSGRRVRSCRPNNFRTMNIFRNTPAPVTSTELYVRAGIPGPVMYSPKLERKLRKKFKLSDDPLSARRLRLAWLIRGVLTGCLPAQQIKTAQKKLLITKFSAEDQSPRAIHIGITTNDDEAVHVALREESLQNVGRILIIDDNEQLAELTGHYLGALGYPSATAHDGIRGWERIIELSPAAVILDVDMPNLSGLGLLEIMRKEPGTAALPVLMWSGNPEHEARARELGANDFVNKPIQLQDLLARLKKLLGHP